MYDGEYTPNRLLQKIAVGVVIAFLAFVQFEAFRNIGKARRRAREKTTTVRIHDIAIELEEGSWPAGPCIRKTVGVDGWGSPIRLMASSRRYVILSFGSDRKPDAVRPGGPMESDAADIIFSNGDWLQRPAGVVTVSDFPPRPADAMAEVVCPEDGAPAGRLMWCETYFYVPTEAAARRAAAVFTGDGYSCEVRRSRSGGDWIAIAGKEPGSDCQTRGKSIDAAINAARAPSR